MRVPRIEGFEIIEKIGEGGMAVVWKARQVSLDRIVAIKILSSQLKGDESDVERFQSEARSAAKLKHPGIVQVHDAGADEQGYCYFVMEYVAGYTIGDWIRRKGQISEEEALVVSECVADALNYAWTTAGIIHCDIKPDNVIIDSDGTVKIADLGLARTINTIGSETMADEVMGTPAYISPEQAEGKSDLDCRSDTYSLGAMMYHMLTGKLMFEGHDEEDVMELQVTTDPVDPKILKPDLSPGMHRLLSSMLAKDPSLRPQNWKEVIEGLAGIRRELEASKPDTEGKHSTRRIFVNHDRLVEMAATKQASGRTAMSRQRLTFLFAGLAVVAVLAAIVYRRSADLPAPIPGSPATTPADEDHGPESGTAGVDVASTLPAEDHPSPEDHEPAVDTPAASTQSTLEGFKNPAAEMLEFARKWAAEHPAQCREAIRRFARVAEDTRGTKYSLMAEEEIERLEKTRSDRTSMVMNELAKKARPLIEFGDLLGAAEIYARYRGPLAIETRLERMTAAESLRKRQRQSRMDEATARRRSELKIKGALDDLADRLLLEGIDAGLEFAVGLAEDPVLAPERGHLEEIAAIIRSASEMDQRILDSFEAQEGMEVTIDLLQGRRTLHIADVRGDRIIGRQMVQTEVGFASSEMVFGLEDLSPRERMSRMGTDTEPEVALVKGVLAFRAKSYTHARRFFEMVGTPLAAELILRVDHHEIGRLGAYE